jgi:hypothetical protein
MTGHGWKDEGGLAPGAFSYHYLLMTGHNLQAISNISSIFNLEVEEI